MSLQSQQILIVEIKTVESVSINPEQLNPMVIYRDPSNNYFVSTGIERLHKAITEAIIRLGSNYRHPLYFDVQVLPGDEMSAFVSSQNRQSPNRRVRKTKNN